MRTINTIGTFAFTHGGNPEFEAKVINTKFKELDKKYKQEKRDRRKNK